MKKTKRIKPIKVKEPTAHKEADNKRFGKIGEALIWGGYDKIPPYLKKN